MSKQARPKRRRTSAQIEELVHRYRESGLLRSRFVLQEGICLATLHRYLTRVSSARVQTAPQFLEVGTIGAIGGREPYRLRFATGLSVEIPAGFCPREVAGLLELIGRAS